MNLLRLVGQLPPVGRRDRQAPVDQQRRAGQAPLVARGNREVRQALAGRGNQESHFRHRWVLVAPVAQ